MAALSYLQHKEQNSKPKEILVNSFLYIPLLYLRSKSRQRSWPKSMEKSAIFKRKKKIFEIHPKCLAVGTPIGKSKTLWNLWVCKIWDFDLPKKITRISYLVYFHESIQKLQLNMYISAICKYYVPLLKSRSCVFFCSWGILHSGNHINAL